MKYQLIISHNFNHIPTEIFNFERYFFNEIEHLHHQCGENDCCTFYWQNIDNQLIKARFSIIIQNKMAFSPFKSTFGGIEFNEEILEEDLFEFLSKIIQLLKIQKIESIEINSYPESYLNEYQNKVFQSCLS